MKKLVTITAMLCLWFGAYAQQSVKLSLKFLPERSYLTRITMNVLGTVTMQGSSPVADSLKAKGLKQNLQLALSASADVNTKTAAAVNGLIPVTMTVQNVNAQPSINGQQIPVPGTMLNGKMVYATAAAENGRLHIDSVSGKRLPDSVLTRINSMMSMSMNQLHFPDKTFRPGDSYTQDVPLNMPMMGKTPVNATTRITYKLNRIAGGKAYFDIGQVTSFTQARPGNDVAISGTGTGTMVYDVRDHYPLSYQSAAKFSARGAMGAGNASNAAFNINTGAITTLSNK